MPAHILGVTRVDTALYLLIAEDNNRYDHDLGRVAIVTEPAAPPRDVLATNDELRVLWCSPSGALWVASANGNVATNAAVAFGTLPARWSYLARIGTTWQAMALPAIATTGSGNGLPPNVEALWGRSDNDIYVATYRGHIYHWNGTAWRQVHDGATTDNNELRAFAAVSATETYAVGQQGTLLHCQGTSWQPVALPNPRSNESLTGLCALADGNVLISGNSRQGSRILRGNATTGLQEIAHSELQLIGMATIGERVLFATGDGVAELIDGAVVVLKDNFKTAAIFPAPDGAFLLEPSPEKPSFIEYVVNREKPWSRRTINAL